MKIAGLILVVLCLLVALASAEEPMPLNEIDAWRLRALTAERAVTEQANRAARLEAEMARLQHQATSRDLADARAAAAKTAGFSLEQWEPDPVAKVWRRR